LSAGPARIMVALCNLILVGVVGFADYVFFFKPPTNYKPLPAARQGDFVPKKVVLANNPNDWDQYRVIAKQFMKPKPVAPPPVEMNPTPAAGAAPSAEPQKPAAPPPSDLAKRVRIARVYYDLTDPARSACYLVVLSSDARIHRAVGEILDKEDPQLNWVITEFKKRTDESGSKYAFTVIFKNPEDKEATLDWAPEE